MHKKYQGAGIILISTALYGLYGIYSRLIATGFTAFNQNWIRNVFVLILICIGILFFNRKWEKLNKKDIPWLLAWNGASVIWVIALFISFNTLSIGTALFLVYAGATITGYILGKVIFNESITIQKIIGILLSLIGLVFVFGGQIHSTSPLFLGIGLLSGVVSSSWNIFPKKISHEYPKLQLLFFESVGIIIINFILSLIFKPVFPQRFVPLAWLGLFAYAVTQLFGDVLLIHGFRKVEAHIGSLLMPMEAIFGALFAFFIFHEVLTTTTIIGGVLILVGAVIPSFREEN